MVSWECTDRQARAGNRKEKDQLVNKEVTTNNQSDEILQTDRQGGQTDPKNGQTDRQEGQTDQKIEKRTETREIDRHMDRDMHQVDRQTDTERKEFATAV